MNAFEFLSYEATPAEKHLGIATIRAWGKIILRYKIVATTDGQGFFSAAATIRGHGMNSKGKEKYEESFLIDSRYDYEQISQLIQQNVTAIRNQASQRSQISNVPWLSEQSQGQSQASANMGSSGSIQQNAAMGGNSYNWAPTATAKDESETPF